MDERTEEKSCVIVIDETLPAGAAANTAAIIGVTLGKRHPEAVGPDVTDGDGTAHGGIIMIPVPVLKAKTETLRTLREKMREAGNDADFVDFSDVAQHCRTYEEYTEKTARIAERDFTYIGLGIFGPRRTVKKLTGSLPLLR